MKRSLSRAVGCGAVLTAIAACTSQLPSARPLGGHSSQATAANGDVAPRATPATSRAKPATPVAAEHAVSSTAAAAHSAAAAPSGAADSQPTDDDASPLGSGPLPAVTLVSAGSAPRRVLRYDVKDGQRETLDMLMNVGMQMEISGHTLPNIPVPPMRAVMSLEVTQADAAGFVYTFSIDRFDAQSAPGTSSTMLSILRQKLAPVVGTRGTASMTSRGFVRGAHVDVPSGVDPTIRRSMLGLEHSMRDMAHPLPEAAVGVGARWDVASNVVVNSMHVQQVLHCHLTSLRGHRATIEERIDQTASPQQLSLPTLPPGSSVELDDYHSHGKGKVMISLSKIVPLRSHAAIQGDSTMQVTAGGHTMPTKAHMTISVDIKPH
jgi:hypothetical protein